MTSRNEAEHTVDHVDGRNGGRCKANKLHLSETKEHGNNDDNNKTNNSIEYEIIKK